MRAGPRSRATTRNAPELTRCGSFSTSSSMKTKIQRSSTLPTRYWCNAAATPSTRSHSTPRAGPSNPRKAVDRRDLLGAELDPRTGGVCNNALPAYRLRNHDEPMRYVPRDDHLSSGCIVLHGDRDQCGITQVAHLEWAVALEHDSALVQPRDDCRVGQRWSPSDLIDLRYDSSRRDQLIDLAKRVVADADCLRQALLLCPDELLPHPRCCLTVGRPVHQPQIDVIQSEPCQAFGERPALPTSIARRQFGRDE